MDGIQAAVLRVKLRHLEAANQCRRAHAAYYSQALSGVPGVSTPVEAPYARHVYHVYAIRTPARDETMRALKSSGVECGVHYPVPVHLQEAYQGLGHQPGAFPVAERCAREFISLPMYPELTEEQLEKVVQSLEAAVGDFSSIL